MIIKFYKPHNPYGYLSNFQNARMFIGGRWWNDVESAFQAAKATTKEDEEAIWKCTTPMAARELGRKIKLIHNWELIKDDVMYDCCMAKFLQNHDLRKQLLSTGDDLLIEDSPYDSYWGCGKSGNGQNKLGLILMNIRYELKEK